MYSGSSSGNIDFGVVGVLSLSGYSNAVEKLASVAAVSGIGDASSMVSSWENSALLKGLWTSRATLITTSNLRASSAVGSK